MTFNKTTRTVLLPIVGYLTYLFCGWIWELFFPPVPFDDPTYSIYGYLRIFGLVLILIAFAFIFQYKVVVPKTITSTRKAVYWAIAIGIVISLLLAGLYYTLDKASLMQVAVSFFGDFMEVESFFLGNLMLIAIFNKLTNKSNIGIE